MQELTPEERADLVGVVRRIQAGETLSEEALDQLVEEFEHRVQMPGASGLIFWSHKHFDHEPTPEEVVDRALGYAPIAL